MSNGGKPNNPMHTAHRYRDIPCAACGTEFMAYGQRKVCDDCKAIKAQTPEAKQKAASQRAVVRAIASGDLIRQPCVICVARGAPSQRGKSHGHHEDYSKPLGVIWLCSFHHIRRHAQLKRQPDLPAMSATEMVEEDLRGRQDFKAKYPKAKLGAVRGDPDFVPSSEPYQIL